MRCGTPFGLDGMYAAVHFKRPVRQALHLLKYQSVSDIVPSLIELFDFSFFSVLPKFDMFIPVPLYPSRERMRGFNQSFLLARKIGERCSIPVESNCLIRVKDTVPQVDLEVKERRKNTRNAFIVRHEERIRGKCIGLIDDVGTTRSTLLECAKVLKRKGAKTAWAIVVAHG